MTPNKPFSYYSVQYQHTWSSRLLPCVTELNTEDISARGNLSSPDKNNATRDGYTRRSPALHIYNKNNARSAGNMFTARVTKTISETYNK